MNISTDILKRLGRLYERRLEPEYFRAIAEAYWLLLLGFSALALLAVVVFGAWECIAVLDDLSAPGNGSGRTPPVGLDRNTLEATLTSSESRSAAYEKAKSGSGFVDPSK